MIDNHDALIYTMVLAAAADRDMTDAELRTIGEMVNYLPVFKDFDSQRLTAVARTCAGTLASSDGLDRVLGEIKESLGGRLRETAYALACDVAASDGGSMTPETLRLLEILRDRLDIDRLVAAAIERASKVRHAVIPR